MSEAHPDIEAVVSEVPTLHTLPLEAAREGYADFLDVDAEPRVERAWDAVAEIDAHLGEAFDEAGDEKRLVTA